MTNDSFSVSFVFVLSFLYKGHENRSALGVALNVHQIFTFLTIQV